MAKRSDASGQKHALRERRKLAFEGPLDNTKRTAGAAHWDSPSNLRLFRNLRSSVSLYYVAPDIIERPLGLHGRHRGGLWNKGKLIGQKPPLKLKEIWALRIRLQLGKRVRDLALFNLAIDSKLRGCDLVKLKVSDVAHGDQIVRRAMVMQQKTSRPVQFELTDPTRDAVAAWITKAKLTPGQFLFPSRVRTSPHLTARQYARVMKRWMRLIGLDPTVYATHSLRRTKATLIYRRTKNIRTVQLLLGHTKLESTVRYLGIEVDDALEISEQTEV